ncbi:unnamed protein product [Durusdinium trenchii]|uniref:Methyltransferase type 11 domain-containing protein n=1 Tax=Durusdinium trenchii TaxID=1381693 RepID=A0ABP0QES7_9DINO
MAPQSRLSWIVVCFCVLLIALPGCEQWSFLSSQRLSRGSYFRSRPRRPLRNSNPKDEGMTPKLPESEPCTCSECWRSSLLRGLGGTAAGVGLVWASNQSPEKLSQKFLVQEMAGMANYERTVRQRKEQIFQKAIPPGVERLVEVGVGAGVNFPYFKNAGVNEVIAVEPNLNFLQSAEAAAKSADIQLQVRQGVMEEMPFPDGSMDVVVGTLLLCSVQDLQRSIAEVKRVLRPGGRYIFTEHVAAKQGDWLRSAQDLLDPLQQAFAAGCHLTRQPLPLIRETFPTVSAESWSLFDDEFAGDGKAALPPHFLLAPHISGYAEA